MKKVYLKDALYQELLDTGKGTIDNEMLLTLVNGKKYQLILAIKFLKEVAENEDSDSVSLVGKIISKDELISKNYELFDDEVLADDRLYKVEIGYIGTLV